MDFYKGHRAESENRATQRPESISRCVKNILTNLKHIVIITFYGIQWRLESWRCRAQYKLEQIWQAKNALKPKEPEWIIAYCSIRGFGKFIIIQKLTGLHLNDRGRWGKPEEGIEFDYRYEAQEFADKAL